METSTTLSELAKALSKFQGEVKNAKKDSENPFFRSKYAALDTIWDTIREPLSKNGLSVSQFAMGENELTSILLHSSGEWIKSTVKMTPKDNTPQAFGSVLTYARRYTLSAILGIATEEDDDGNAATGNKEQKSKTYLQQTKSDNSEAQKKHITSLLIDLGVISETSTMDEIKEAIKQKTDLLPYPKNFVHIIARLEELCNPTGM